MQAEDLLLIKTISDIQLSPNGEHIAYVLTEMDAEKDAYRTSIWVVSTQSRELIQFTRGAHRNTSPRWSPDGSWLTFLSDRDGGPSRRLYLLPANSGDARGITSLAEGAGPAIWSPDSTTILFSAYVPKEMSLAGKNMHTGWHQLPRVVSQAHYKADGQDYTRDACSHLFVVPVSSGDSVQITDGDCDDFAPAWSPDGRRSAFCRKRNGTTDFNESDIWVVDADGSNLRQITTNVRHATSPSWSPDGASIAFYGTDDRTIGLEESLFRVWIVPASGGTPRCLTAEYDRGVIMLPRPAVTPGPVWSPDSAAVTFTVADKGNIHVMRVSVVDGTISPVVIGERQVTSFSAVTGRIAFCATDPYNLSDVYVCAWDGSEERRLTWVNESVLARLNMPKIERRTFKSPNGETIDGWLMLPTTGNRPLPLLVDIHGGPHGFVGNYFSPSHFYRYVLASRGWAVLTLNPSGSGSYGETFAHSIRGRWGEYDMFEQLAAVDALIGEGIVDGERLAVAGYSYGGYMAAWIIGHTDRFKAAAIGAPITNLESFFGTSDIGMWYIPWEMRGDIAMNQETFRRLSPVNYADRVTAPTLILHGEGDKRCPIGQSEEFYARLMAAGKAAVEFVRYPSASHLFISNGLPSHRVDYNRRVMGWVERYTLTKLN